MGKYTLFLDRDGIINYDSNYINSISKIIIQRDFLIFYNKIKPFIDKTFIVTNQSGIARGYFGFEEAKKINDFVIKKLSEQNVIIHDWRMCPHHIKGKVKLYSIDCNCRKPSPGMVNDLCEKYMINKNESIMIGDKLVDVQCGKNAGLAFSFCVKSGSKNSSENCNRFEKVLKQLRIFTELD